MDDILDQLKKPRNFIVLALFATAFIVVIPQLDSFNQALKTLDGGSVNYILLSIAFSFTTFAVSALIYWNLAFRALKLMRTFIVQLAAMFINRLLPAGVGAIGVNYLYLRNNKHTKTQAGTVVAINNLLGGIGHNLLFGCVVIFSSYSLASSHNLTSPGGYVLFVGFVLVATYIIARFNKKAEAFIRSVLRQLKAYKKQPHKLLTALLFSMLLTLSNVLSLYFAAQAFGINLDFAKTFVVFTIGVSGGAITPTPGGLGGFEAGLTAGYVAFGVDSETALSAALLYRLISYWLMMPIGALAFIFTLKKKWV